jgi:hypothetical protein
MSPAPGHAAAPSVERLYRLGNAWTRIDPIVSHNCSLSDDRDGGPAVPMSALAQRPTWRSSIVMSALPANADVNRRPLQVGFVPQADIAHSNDFRVFFATSIKARSFGARDARCG